MEQYEEYLRQTFEFNTSVYENEWCGERTVIVTLKISKKEWDKADKGRLYNCDLSNFLSRKGKLDFYAAPIVDDSKRASKGIKTITIKFVKRGA